MSIAAPPSGLQPEDYDEIEAAVMETARGRWFLSEYARRTCAAESESLRMALGQIVARLDALGAPPKTEAVPIIERLDALAWKLRERGVDDYVCGKIEALMREIAAGGVVLNAAAAQPQQADQTPTDMRESVVAEADMHSTAPVPPSQEEPETRGADCPKECAASLAPGVEEMEAHGFGEVIASTAIDVPASAPPAIDPRLDALLWLDGLPLLDRMALFA